MQREEEDELRRKGRGHVEAEKGGWEAGRGIPIGKPVLRLLRGGAGEDIEGVTVVGGYSMTKMKRTCIAYREREVTRVC